jgi:hypothetical protein
MWLLISLLMTTSENRILASASVRKPLSYLLTSVTKIKKPSVSLPYQWILTSWERIFPESVVSGFKNCCLSNAMDKSEDNVIWQNCGEKSSSENEIHDSSADPSNSKELEWK